MHPLNSRANSNCLRDKANLGNERAGADMATATHSARKSLRRRRVDNKASAKHQNCSCSTDLCAFLSFSSVDLQATSISRALPSNLLRLQR